MIRFLFRFLATVSLAVAVIMAVLDATRTVAAGSLVTTPLGTSWLAVSPATLESAQAAVETWLHPALWDPAGHIRSQIAGLRRVRPDRAAALRGRPQTAAPHEPVRAGLTFAAIENQGRRKQECSS